MRDRRTFLSGLASLPLIGGRVTLIGAPTAAAVQVSPALLSLYETWLGYERHRVLRELHGDDLGAQFERHLVVFGPAIDWHHAHAEAPSTRAAVLPSCPATRPASPQPTRPR